MGYYKCLVGFTSERGKRYDLDDEITGYEYHNLAYVETINFTFVSGFTDTRASVIRPYDFATPTPPVFSEDVADYVRSEPYSPPPPAEEPRQSNEFGGGSGGDAGAIGEW